MVILTIKKPYDVVSTEIFHFAFSHPICPVLSTIATFPKYSTKLSVYQILI